MNPSKTRKRRPAKDAAFDEALRRLEAAPDKEYALAEFLDEVLPGMERLSSVSHEMSMLAKIGLANEQTTEYLAGLPSFLIDVKELEAPSTEILADQALRARIHRRLFDKPMLTAAAVAELLGSRSVNRRQYANDLRKKGALLGLPDRNRYVYPAFQFDIPERRLRPIVAKVNQLLGAVTDPWGLACWWLFPHGGLEPGTAPADLLDRPDADALVQRLADAELDPVG